MNTYRYGYAMSDEDDDEKADDKPKKNGTQKKDESADEYGFEGYEVEINTKVALLPKTGSKT